MSERSEPVAGADADETRSRVALTREVSVSLPHCELSHQARRPVDVERARRQHAAYRTALSEAGADVVLLPPEDRFPDAVFVEDTAVVTDEVAVITRPGAASRRGETETIAAALAGYRPLVRLSAPARLDGGDVLRMGRRVFVGRSGRTNAEGFAALREALAPHGYDLVAVEADGCLHLKSAVAAVDGDTVLVNPRWVDVSLFADYDVVETPGQEPAAANLLRVRDTLIVSDAYPRTMDLLAARGLRLRPVSVDEFHKAEGGLTCMSILLRRGG